MPITINGSGTVTGISAGGLPDGCIVTADIADNNVTTAKIDNISVTEIKIADANITPAKLAQPLTLETAKAWNWNSLTTNTSLDFTSIPSWVKRVTVMFNGVSTNGTSLLVVRLGTSGGVVSSGYNGAASSVGSTVVTQQWASGFGLRGATTAAADIYEGHMLLSLIDGNDWISSHTMALSNTPVTLFGAGSVTLSGTLTQLRITTVNGSDTFDAGSINILYEG